MSENNTISFTGLKTLFQTAPLSDGGWMMNIFLPDSHEGVERELVRHRWRNGWLAVVVFLLINNTGG